MTHTLRRETCGHVVYGPLTDCVDETEELDTCRAAVSGSWQWATLECDDRNFLCGRWGGILDCRNARASSLTLGELDVIKIRGLQPIRRQQEWKAKADKTHVFMIKSVLLSAVI